MKFINNSFIVSLLLWVSLNAYGQADLNVQIFPSKVITLSDTSITARVLNVGDAPSGPFRIKVWASYDSIIGDDDLAAMSPSTLPGLEPFEADLQNSERETIQFKFPLPPPDSRELPRLVGDTLDPVEWIGRTMYARGCIMNAAGTIEIECTKVSNVGNARTVAPPIFMEGLGSLFTPLASNGDSTDFIDLRWPVPREDNGRLLIDSYRVTEVDFNGVNNLINLPISELELITDDAGQQFYRTMLAGREPGRRYDYSQGLRVCLGVTCTPTSSNGGTGIIGNTYASITASTIFNGRVETSWEAFSNTRPSYYYVSRCVVGQAADDCLELATLITSTEFVDRDVERGKQYIYTVDACASVSTVQGSLLCDANSRFRIAVSNPGESGLVDDFEDDDNPQQATLVDGPVSQLHSFDTPDDQDWIKLLIRSAQSIVVRTSGETSEDTKITLYESGIFDDPGNSEQYEILVSTNTPDVQFASYATLETDELLPGEYFVKVEQESIPGLPAISVFNYMLDVEMEAAPIVMSPIIDLLLSD